MSQVVENVNIVNYGLDSINQLAKRFGADIDVNFDAGGSLDEIDKLTEISEQEQNTFLSNIHAAPEMVQLAESDEDVRPWVQKEFLMADAVRASETIEEVTANDNGQSWIEKRVAEYKEGCEDFVNKLLAAKPFVDKLLSA